MLLFATTAAAAASFAAAPRSARAADTNWLGGTGDWFDAAKWSADVPTSGTSAAVGNGGVAQLATGPAAASTLSLGGDLAGGGTGTLAHSGGQLTVGGLVVGNTDAGSYQLSGTGTLAATGMLTVGRTAPGSLALDASTASTAAGLRVGESAAGTVTQSSGTLTVTSEGRLGYNAGVDGTYNLTGGRLISSGFETMIGYAGSGTFTNSGGTQTTNSGFTLGELTGSSGRYTISAGSLTTGGLLVVGADGAGTFTQTGGAVATGASTNVILGQSSGSGRYDMSNGTLATKTLDVRRSSTFTQSGGTISGVTPPGFPIVRAELIIASGSTFRMDDGTTWLSTMTVGGFSSAPGPELAQTGGTLNGGSEDVRGDLVHRGGAHTVSSLTVNSTGSLLHSGGTLTAGSFNTDGKLIFELDPDAPFSPIQVTNTPASFGGNLFVELPDDAASTIAPGDQFTLLTGPSGLSAGGQFVNVSPGGRLWTDEGSFRVNYGPFSPLGNNKLVLSDFQVPEPGSASLVLGGAAVAMLRRRRRR